MSIPGAQLLVTVLGAYVLAGVVFAGCFAWRGAPGLDARVRGSSRSFRMAILPAAVALWPWLAWLWWRGANTRGRSSGESEEGRP